MTEPPARQRLTGREIPADRVHGTVATAVVGLERGATVFRVHDVRPVRDALVVAAAIFDGWPSSTTTTT